MKFFNPSKIELKPLPSLKNLEKVGEKPPVKPKKSHGYQATKNNKQGEYRFMPRDEAAAFIAKVLREDRPYLDKLYEFDQGMRIKEKFFRANARHQLNYTPPKIEEISTHVDETPPQVVRVTGAPNIDDTIPFDLGKHTPQIPGAHVLNNMQTLRHEATPKDPVNN